MSYEYIGLKPTPQQLQTIAFMLRNKRGYNFSDMGSGKTASSLWATDMLLAAKKISKVLIICPLSLMRFVWAAEIEKILPHRTYAIIHGHKIKRSQLLALDVDFYIINHDGPKHSMDMLIKYDFDVVIVDEVCSHTIKYISLSFLQNLIYTKQIIDFSHIISDNI